MSSDLEPLEKAKEAAEEGKKKREMAPVSLTIAILAVFVAIMSLLGHRAHTEELLLQNQTTDKWAHFQAKSLRAKNIEALDELLAAIDSKNAEKAQQADAHFQSDMVRYRKEQETLEEEAKDLQSKLEEETRRADIFDVGEVFLEIALVVTSITLLTDNRRYWHLGIGLACVGIIVATSGFLVHWFPPPLLKLLH